MATKKISTTEPLADSTVSAGPEIDTKPKPPLTQASATAEAMDVLSQSRLVPTDEAQATVSPELPLADSEKILNGPVENLVAKVFESNPDNEFTVSAVLAELKQIQPDINENSIRFTITELKRKSVIHHVRNQGHYQILKYTKPGEEKPFPRAPILDKLTTKSALKTSPADVASDLAVLKEATAAIARLHVLIHRNQEILFQVSKLRAIL
jgi:predicted transcriptional regulator